MWRIREAAFVSSLVVISFACIPLVALAQEEYALLTSRSIIELTNLERREEALPQYRENRMLTDAAEEKAIDMATRGYFSHATPEGEKSWNLIREHGYAFSRVGENLAVKFSDPERVISSWLASPGHRANILNEKFVDIGVGIAEGVYQGATTTFVVALFGVPAHTAPEERGEVKGEQEPSHESAGLMASFQPEIPEPEKGIALAPEEPNMTVTVGIQPRQQAAAVSVSRVASFRDGVATILEFLWSLYR